MSFTATTTARLAFAALRGPSAMDEVEAIVAHAAPEIEHIGPESVAAMEEDALLLDVRSEREYDRSHLNGAVRVDPGTIRGDFMSAFGHQAEGRRVVFYCSLGWRSSKLAARVKPGLEDRGAHVANMSGGIFRWANEHRPLVTDDALTDRVHPLAWPWSRMLKRD